MSPHRPFHLPRSPLTAAIFASNLPQRPAAAHKTRAPDRLSPQTFTIRQRLWRRLATIPALYHGRTPMNRFWTTLSVLGLASMLAAPSLAEMTIHLKDGRSFTLPVDPQDID